MNRKATPNKSLQTPATDQAETEEQRVKREHEGGHGGSYSQEAGAGALTLAQRTEPAIVARRNPLRDEKGQVVREDAFSTRQPESVQPAGDTPESPQ